MQVNGVNGGNGFRAAGTASPAQDAVSRSIKQQIANLQKQMQQLSSNQDMGAEEKMKKRQELQKQISDLNIELRQHQMEQQQAERARAQKKQKESAEVEELTGTKKASGEAGGISQAGMQSIISADASLAQAKVQGSVAKQAEGRANVLKAEIKQDGPGKSAEMKEEQLARVEQTKATASAAQADTRGKANEALQEAGSEKDGTTPKAEDRKTKEEKTDRPQKEKEEKEETGQAAPTHVDVRL